MAKNFEKANSVKTIKRVAKTSNESANVITVKMISTENLIDYPKNGEDLENTIDLENSIKELGFIDPIEVTNFNMEDDKYMIVSGHRRRRAGNNVGVNVFPCIIKTFKNDEEVNNYALLANSQRDSAKDPLLFCKRYKMHEEYLVQSGYKGSVREEISKRLGISIQQADRYKQFNKIILPIWDMVRSEMIGMSSALPMASHTIEEQKEILQILNECIEQKQKLTREIVDKIIKGYREGKKNYIEIFQINFVLSNEDEKQKQKIEVETEYVTNKGKNEISAIAPIEEKNDLHIKEDTKEIIDNKDEKKIMDNESEKLYKGEKLSQTLKNVENILNDYYSFENVEKAENIINTMMTVTKLLINEMIDISQEYEKTEKIDILLNDITNELNNLKNISN